MKEQLENYIQRYVRLTAEEFESLWSVMTIRSYKKKAFLLREGEVCRHKMFLLKGLTRSFYLDEKGREQILLFAIENWWLTNLESFVQENPSKIYIQALEDTDVCMIPKAELEKLYRSIPKLERLFRLLTENMLIAIQRKYEFFWKLDSKGRYEHLVQGIPDFAQRVPQYMIASYLEITPEYLSELRKKNE